MTTRRNCINNSSFSYTGKEQSPLRFGLSAEGYPINSILEGFDKNIWVVEIKNNRKIWVRKYDDFRITYDTPLINNINDYNKQIENNDDTTLDEDNSQPIKINEDKNEIINTSVKTPKKPTNYNIFLTYRLKKLKEEYKKDGKPNKDKEIFKLVIKEWNDYKTKPDALKIILDEALSNT